MDMHRRPPVGAFFVPVDADGTPLGTPGGGAPYLLTSIRYPTGLQATREAEAVTAWRRSLRDRRYRPLPIQWGDGSDPMRPMPVMVGHPWEDGWMLRAERFPAADHFDFVPADWPGQANYFPDSQED